MILDILVENHPLYFSVAHSAKGSNLDLDDLTDIQTVRMLFVYYIIIGVYLDLGLGGSLCFCNFLVEINIRYGVIDCCWVLCCLFLQPPVTLQYPVLHVLFWTNTNSSGAGGILNSQT